MKNVCMLALFAFGFVTTVSAQTKGDVEFGINVGLNASTIITSDDYYYYDINAIAGFNAAFAADYYFSDRWSIKGKLIYDQKGWEEPYTDFNDMDPVITAKDIKIRLNYLSVPIMANWHFGKKRNWYLDFGPYAGFLTNATFDGEDVENGINKTDFGIALGIGVKIPVSNKLKINIEYEVLDGFTDVFDGNETSRFVNVRGALNVGVNFMLK